jgi:hypothetical protein
MTPISISELASSRFFVRLDENGMLLGDFAQVFSINEESYCSDFEGMTCLSVEQIYGLFRQEIIAGTKKYAVPSYMLSRLVESGTVYCTSDHAFLKSGHCEHDVSLPDAIEAGLLELI